MEILGNGLVFDHLNGELQYTWTRVRQNGREFYRAAAFRELFVLTDDPFQDRLAGEGIFGKQWGAVVGLYNAGINILYIACGIFAVPNDSEIAPSGVVQLYGATSEGETPDEAGKKAVNDLAAIEATLAGYAQARFKAPEMDTIRWYVDFVSKAQYPLILLGHPDPRIKRSVKSGVDGALSESTDDLSLEQNEILFRGLAKLRQNFVFQVTGNRLSRDLLTKYLHTASRLASIFASRRRGSKSVGFSIGIPLMNALGHGFSGASGRSQATAEGVTNSQAHGWGENYGESKAHTTSDAFSHTLGEAFTESGSVSKGTAHTDSWAKSLGVAHTVGTSESSGSGFSSGWNRSMNASMSEGGNLGMNLPLGIKFGGNATIGQSQGVSWGESASSFSGSGNFESVTHSITNTLGGADSNSTVKTDGWAHTTSESYTSTHSESDTVAQSHGQSENWGEGHAMAISRSEGGNQGGSEILSSGMSFGLMPSISLNRTWQMEDDLADRLTEILRGFEGLINTAVHGGGFAASAYLLTDTQQGAAAAAALVPQAFYGETVPTPVCTVLPQEREEVIQHALAFAPMDTPNGNQNDLFDGWLFWKGATMLPASKLAAYIAPGVFQEGTLKVIAPIPHGVGFYPNMPGEVVLGHQYSPATAELTGVQVRLDRPRLMHTLFAGNTGFGKSVAAMRMVYEMARCWGMRVVVLDFGFAWRSLLNAPGLEGRVDIRQLRPDGVRPLRWNPMQIGTFINPETQLKAFADIFGSVAQLGQKQQQHRLLDAARTVYLRAGVLVDDPEVRANPNWGVVRQDEVHLTGTEAGTALRDLPPEQRQKLAVERSRSVGLQELFHEVEMQYESLPPRDQVGRGVLEGILWRLKSLVHGAPSAQFAPGKDALPIEDLGRPDGVVILEGGKFLDNFAKAWLLGWAGWLIYSDMVVRRERQLNQGEADLFMVFEEANIIFSGMDGGDPQARLGPTMSEQYGNMFRDARKYGAFFGVITQSPSLIPEGIRSSCNNLVVGYLSDPKDKDVVLSAIARSEKGFVDEPWRRFIADEHIGMVIGRFPYVYNRESQLPFLFHPLILDVPEPSDNEIAQKVGRIVL